MSWINPATIPADQIPPRCPHLHRLAATLARHQVPDVVDRRVAPSLDRTHLFGDLVLEDPRRVPHRAEDQLYRASRVRATAIEETMQRRNPACPRT